MDLEERSDGSSTSPLSTTYIIVICVGGALVLLIFVVLIACCIKKRNNVNIEQEPNDIKLQTLGTQYAISSVPTSVVGSRSNSVSTYANERQESIVEREKLIKSSLGNITEDALEADEVDNRSRLETTRNATNTYYNIAPERIPKDQLDLPDQLTGKARSGSTYLQYHDAISRRCSTSSQNFSMTDLEEQSRRELEHLNAMKDVASKAPLAKPESLHSLVFQSNEHISKMPPTQSVVDTETAQESLQRPKSDGNAKQEKGRFIPKLPPKKKRVFHKSTNDMLAVQNPQTNNLQPSRSENCLNKTKSGNDELSDYDDLPLEKITPVLPPKTRPNLPPKQKINKSHEDLALIEKQFKSSLTDLRTYDQMDYDDLPEDSDLSATPNIKGRISANSHEFADYDDPVNNYHETNDRNDHRKSSGLNEYMDYDDPIHHAESLNATV